MRQHPIHEEFLAARPLITPTAALHEHGPRWAACPAGGGGQLRSVENVLDILRGGIDSALLGPGRSSIHDLTPHDLVIPPGFTRALGGRPGGSPQTRSMTAPGPPYRGTGLTSAFEGTGDENLSRHRAAVGRQAPRQHGLLDSV
jgi:hypothetical protein